MIQLVSNVRPSSNENDCCHRAEDGVMPFQVEAHLGCPSAEKVVRWASTIRAGSDVGRGQLDTPVIGQFGDGDRSTKAQSGGSNKRSAKP